MLEIVLPLTLFSLANSATPGPNNIMLTASGSTFGLRRSIPHIIGISIGFPVMVYAVGLGLGEIFTRYPQVHLTLKWLGAAYLLYLAWRIMQSGGANSGGSSNGRPLTFVEAAAFQWVNPKAWMMAVSAIPAYTTIGGNYYLELLLISLVFAVICVPSCVAWCMFGVGIRQLIRSEETARLVNLGLAGLVVLSIGLLFL